MKALLRAVLGRVVADYRINWIYAADAVTAPELRPGDAVVPIDDPLRAMLAESATDKMRGSLSYARAGMQGLALVRDGVPLCVLHVARPEQYDRSATWPLRAGDMAMMDIATELSTRGQGLAPQVICASTGALLTGSTRRLIAFIWWSNTPSVRAFTKAGWRRIGLSLEWQMAGRWWSVKLPL